MFLWFDYWFFCKFCLDHSWGCHHLGGWLRVGSGGSTEITGSLSLSKSLLSSGRLDHAFCQDEEDSLSRSKAEAVRTLETYPENCAVSFSLSKLVQLQGLQKQNLDRSDSTLQRAVYRKMRGISGLILWLKASRYIHHKIHKTWTLVFHKFWCLKGALKVRYFPCFLFSFLDFQTLSLRLAYY